jgi:hypothetical protein
VSGGCCKPGQKNGKPGQPGPQVVRPRVRSAAGQAVRNINTDRLAFRRKHIQGNGNSESSFSPNCIVKQSLRLKRMTKDKHFELIAHFNALALGDVQQGHLLEGSII